MPDRFTSLALYQASQLALPLLRYGMKSLAGYSFPVSTDQELVQSVGEMIRGRVRELVEAGTKRISEKDLKNIGDTLVRFTGVAFEILAWEVLGGPVYAPVKNDFAKALYLIPNRWTAFAVSGHASVRHVALQDFIDAIKVIHESGEVSAAFNAVDPATITAFFSSWLRDGVGSLLWKQGWYKNMAAPSMTCLAKGFADSPAADNPAAVEGICESLRRFQARELKLIAAIKALKREEERRAARRRFQETFRLNKTESIPDEITPE